MKMGKNDPRDSMSKSAKGSGYGNMKGKNAGPNEVCAPGAYSDPKGPSGGSKGRNLQPEPVADSGKGVSGKAEVG